MTNNRQRACLIPFILAAIIARGFAGEVTGIDPGAVPRLTPANDPAAPKTFEKSDCLVDAATLAGWA